MRRLSSFLSTLLPTILMAACGGGGGGAGTDPLSEDRQAEICADICAYYEACSGEPDPNCQTACASELDFLRGDAVEILADCTLALECTQSDDVCLDMVDALPVHEDLEAACTAGLTACAASTDECATDGWKLLTPSVVEQLIACYGEACDMIDPCIEAIGDVR